MELFILENCYLSLGLGRINNNMHTVELRQLFEEYTRLSEEYYQKHSWLFLFGNQVFLVGINNYNAQI